MKNINFEETLEDKLNETCTDKNAKHCTHFFFCGSQEHLQICCLKKRNKSQRN